MKLRDKILIVISLLLPIIAMHYGIGRISLLPPITLYVSYGCALLFILSKVDYVEINWLFLLLYLPLTILASHPSPVFRSGSRLACFALLFLVCSPVLQSKDIAIFRQRLLKVIVVLCSIISLFSFIGYFVGVNFCTIEGDYIVDYVGQAGHFSGVTRQSMFLGPFSGVAAVFLFHKFLRSRKAWLLLLLAASLGSMLLSSSRSAFGATIIGCLLVLYFLTNNKTLFVKRVLLLCILLAITFPIWEFSTLALKDKQLSHSDDSEFFDTRAAKFECRLQEFSSSPIFGIGFAAIDPSGEDPYNVSTGTIEPGSSWLAVLSMTGMIGMIVFCLLMIKTFRPSIYNEENIWLLGLLAFFFVHMVVEGYVFAAGNPNCFILWTVIGVNYDASKYSLK